MDPLQMDFAVSGVSTSLLVPPLVALVFSFVSSLGGLSGAFLILPFQMSFLGYTAPSVTATNFVFNIVAIPAGVMRFIREGRMNWPLTWVLVAGTMPGLLAGYYIRVRYLPEPGRFKTFVGLVLLYMAVRLVRDSLRPGAAPTRLVGRIEAARFSPTNIEFRLNDHSYTVRTPGLLTLSAVVGIVGGAYGIGGGALIAPYLVAVLGLPVYAIAGATLTSTFMTSVAGAAVYQFMPGGAQARPDWALGALFGLGGMAGIYLGARAQKYVPQRLIKITVAMALLSVAYRYLIR